MPQKSQSYSISILFKYTTSLLKKELLIVPTCFRNSENVFTVIDNGVAAVVCVQDEVVGDNCGHFNKLNAWMIESRNLFIQSSPGFRSKLTISSAKAGSGCIADPLIFTFASDLNVKCQV